MRKVVGYLLFTFAPLIVLGSLKPIAVAVHHIFALFAGNTSDKNIGVVIGDLIGMNDYLLTLEPNL